jgi:hypothetical protein
MAPLCFSDVKDLCSQGDEYLTRGTS